MSEFLTTAAQAMNAPEVLVQRSAEARAKATGGSADDILAAWAGGEAVPAAAPAAPAAEAPAPKEETPPTPVPVPEAAPVAAPQPEPVAAVVAVVEAPTFVDEDFEAAPLRDRMRRSGRIGALVGLVLALGAILFGSQWLLPRATSVDVDGSLTTSIDIVGGWMIVGLGLVSLVIGVAVAGGARLVTGWYGRGMRLVSSAAGTVVLGAVAGFLIGALVAGVVVGSGTPNELAEGITTIPLVGSVLWTLAGWVAGGWLIGVLIQAVGVPAGIDDSEAEESEGVRARLAAAFSLPPLAASSILLVVLPVAYVFISFPEWAWLLAIFISGAILAFAGLSASRPGMTITRGEFLAAAAGIGVVVIIVMAVLNAQGAGHGEEDDHGGEGEEAAVVLVIS